MPQGLRRFYGGGDLHFITCSCYHQQPLLATPDRRDLFLNILEEVRKAKRFVVVGYVVMPEHFHLLISEPDHGTPSTVMQVLKQRFARRLHGKGWDNESGILFDSSVGQVWQERFYDFNVWTSKKRIEKLRYMHRNPVKRGLVDSPEKWRWSSYRFYLFGELGPVQVNVGWTEISLRDRVACNRLCATIS